MHLVLAAPAFVACCLALPSFILAAGDFRPKTDLDCSVTGVKGVFLLVLIIPCGGKPLSELTLMKDTEGRISFSGSTF